MLGQGAVHGAFAGFTGFTVGLVNTHYVYLPIPVIIQDTRKVDPRVSHFGFQYCETQSTLDCAPDHMHILAPRAARSSKQLWSCCHLLHASSAMPQYVHLTKSDMQL